MKATTAATRPAAGRSLAAANLALLVLTVGFTLLVLEITARFILPSPLPWNYPQLRYRPDPALIFTLQPNQRGFSADKEILINERGLRGPVVPYERVPGTKRILLLGDSLAFGFGVRDDEVVSERIRVLLDGVGIRSEVINTGVSSYNTEQEVAYYEREGHRYAPDVVIVGVCWNDLNDKSDVRVDSSGNLVDAIFPAGTNSADASTQAAEFQLRNLLKRSRLLYGSLERWRAYVASRSPDDHSAFRSDVLAGRTTPRIAEGWSRIENALLRLRTLVDQQGARLLLVAFPVPLAVEQSFPASSYPGQMQRFASREGMPFIDLTGPFQRNFRGHESLFIPFDGDHPNAAGHDLAAQEIMRILTPWLS